MRSHLFFLTGVLLGVAVWAAPIRAEERSLAFLFGPSDAGPARAAAKAASAAALKLPASSVGETPSPEVKRHRVRVSFFALV